MMSAAFTSIEPRVRDVLRAHANLQGATEALPSEASLYELGMTSRAAVTVMLALESEFDLEFPDAMLRRDVFESVHAISRAIMELLGGK
jgi:acyl carrier protein